MRMRSVRVLGVALVTSVTLGAVAVSAANAAAPEYMICVKQKGSGKYNDKACAEENTEGTGNYERASWELAKKKTFKAKNAGPIVSEIVNPLGQFEGGPTEPGKIFATVTCQKEKTVGQVTGPQTMRWKTEYSKCEGANQVQSGFKCQSKEHKAGVIVFEELESTLVNLDKGPNHKRVGIRVRGLGPNGRVDEVECPSTLSTEVFGEVLMEVKGNLNKAAKVTEDVASAGPLRLQSDLYEEEAFSEEEGKAVLEWDAKHIGPQPAPEPIVKTGKLGEPLNEEGPCVEFGLKVMKGEAFLIAD